jgi:hypothetical protein
LNKLVLLAAILFTFVSGRSTDASSLYALYDFMASSLTSVSLAGSGTFAIDGAPSYTSGGELTSVSGNLNESPITGFSGSINFSSQRYDITFITASESATLQTSHPTRQSFPFLIARVSE